MKNQENQENEVPLMFSRILFAGINPLELSDKTAAIFGLGGLGVIVAEMLARVGIGKLILVDRDIVGEENLNRLGYTYEDIGKPKAEALAEKLMGIAKARGELKLEIETYTVDIVAWEKLRKIVEESDILFTCLDNLEARLEVNYWAVKLRKPLVDGGTSLNGRRGRIITVIPYQTPCLGCYFDEETLMGSEETHDILTCGASLPTTMSIVAALQVEMGLRILLRKRNVVPRIFINLEDDDIIIVNDRNVKRRRDCPYCGVDRS